MICLLSCSKTCKISKKRFFDFKIEEMNLKNVFFSFLLLIFFFSNYSYSQKFNSVDIIVLKYPKHFETPRQLADQIQKDFTSENEKARAIYTWMALNISYDVKTWLNPKPIKTITFKTQLEKDLKLQEIKNVTLKNVFKKQLAVCSGYSLLFNHLATLVGLKSDVIEGMAKTTSDDIGRRKPVMNHAWNAVMIDGTWRLIDVTWGAGTIVNKQNLWIRKFNPDYFDADPNFFFAKHLPASGVWLNQIIDEEKFLNGPLLFEKYFEILTPKSGVVEANDGDKMVFRIKNILKFEDVYYLDKQERPIKVESPKEENGILEFQVTYNRKIGRFLTFYLYGKSIATFKIISKNIPSKH